MKNIGRSAVLALLGVVLFSSLRLSGAAQTGTAPQLFAPFQLKSGASIMDVAFTPDEQTMFATLSESRHMHTIVESHLVDGQWKPYHAVPFSGTWRDLEEVLTADSKAMIFASNRPTTPGGKALDGYYGARYRPGLGGNLWIVRRVGSGWGNPTRLPDAINANTSTFSPTVAADGTLYFMRATGAKGQFHLFVSHLVAGSYRSAEPAPFASRQYGEFDPTVAPDNSFVIFSSTRPPTPHHANDLFIAFNHGGHWSTPVDMGQPINPGRDATEARLSPGARQLYYSSAAHVVFVSLAQRLNALAAH